MDYINKLVEGMPRRLRLFRGVMGGLQSTS